MIIFELFLFTSITFVLLALYDAYKTKEIYIRNNDRDMNFKALKARFEGRAPRRRK